jgi:hypothetical protein
VIEYTHSYNIIYKGFDEEGVKIASLRELADGASQQRHFMLVASEPGKRKPNGK